MSRPVLTLLLLVLSVAGGPPLHAQVLPPDDAWVRTFERWRPDLLNPRNEYTWLRARSDFNGWRPLFWAAGLSVLERRGRIVSTAEQGRVLRVTYPAGKFGSAESGVSFPWLLSGRYEELLLSYRVRFDEGFLFTTTGKLPGVCGANDDLGCYRYTGGNRPHGDDGFSVRPVWLDADGLAGSYVYHAGQAGEFGDIFVWQHANGEPVRFVRGQWHTLQVRVRLNQPGIADGEVEAWLDEEPVSLVSHMLFRNDSARGRDIRINEVYFNTFHGGRHPEDAPARTQHAFFDGLRLFGPPHSLSTDE
jgi:hypothetical protein